MPPANLSLTSMGGRQNPMLTQRDRGTNKGPTPAVVSYKALSDFDPFDEVDAALRDICWPPCVTGPIPLPRLRLFSRLKKWLAFVIGHGHIRRHLPVHDPRGRSSAEIDGYEQRF